MNLAEQIKAIPYWYHRIELPDGTMTPGWAPICAEKYAIPADLTGKRVLDIGAWDGYWTWEALKRGAAEVVAIDDFSDTCGSPGKIKRNGWETFDLCREAFGFVNCPDSTNFGMGYENDKGQKVKRIEMSVYDISEKILGRFDVVFFFGTIYHLKHPLLALEKISAICDGEMYIESAICDDFSPYKGGLERGYRNHDMIVEFYPSNEYGQNPGNWWSPTLQCLGYMVQSVGFQSIELWRLTENPNGANQCRGFVYASKKEYVPAEVKEQAYTEKILKKTNIMAVMSVPRFGLEDTSSAILESLRPLQIPLLKVWGVFWGQSLERGFQTQIDNGAEIILVIDNDTVYKKEDLQELIALMEENPQADAIVALQLGRQGKGALCSIRSKTGQRIINVPHEKFNDDLTQIATGNFGLTLIRTEALMKMQHPWFLAQPDKDGQWGRDRTDADIYFWRKFAATGNRAYLANHVVIGHIEEVVTWPDKNMNPIYQVLPDWRKDGKPKNVWR